MATGRQVKRLFDLEIDEVSLVDRPANQFGKVAFSKRAEDDMPNLFDLDGNEVTEDELEHGETVTDENGNEFVFLQEGTPEFDELVADVDDSYDDGDDYDDEDAYDDDLVGVGKSMVRNGIGITRNAGRGSRRKYYGDLARAGARDVRGAAGRAGGRARNAGINAGARAAARGSAARSSAAGAVSRGRGRAADAGRSAQMRGLRADIQTRSAIGRNPYRTVGGSALVGAGGATVVDRRRRVGKSFGGEIYEELSKALTQSDRDQAIAKALDVVDELAAQNEELYDIVGKMADDAALEDFSKLAEEYGPLPVHPARLGQIMKRASDTLPEEDVAILDRLFSSVGDQLYTEVGKAGTGASVDVWDQVQALANDVVAKSDMTPEQAVTAIFAENPDAYDEYVAEHEFAIRGR